jgi:hypothetical protein
MYKKRYIKKQLSKCKDFHPTLIANIFIVKHYIYEEMDASYICFEKFMLQNHVISYK